jgi:hypothetical protein
MPRNPVPTESTSPGSQVPGNPVLMSTRFLAPQVPGNPFPSFPCSHWPGASQVPGNPVLNVDAVPGSPGAWEPSPHVDAVPGSPGTKAPGWHLANGNSDTTMPGCQGGPSPQWPSSTGTQGPMGTRSPATHSPGAPGIQGPHAAKLLLETCRLCVIGRMGPWSGLVFPRPGFHGPMATIHRKEPA